MLNSSNYLRNLISCVRLVDTDKNLNNYLKITGILNNMFRPQKTLKTWRIKLYSTPVLPALLCGNENWITKAKDARRRVETAELKYTRKTA